jgi:hypothetical protein
MSEDVESKYSETIRELRRLEKELSRKGTTADSAISYIEERHATVKDQFARKDFESIGSELRENKRVDFAIDSMRETLASRYIDESGFRDHASDCATSNAPALSPGPCDCRNRGTTQPA